MVRFVLIGFAVVLWVAPALSQGAAPLDDDAAVAPLEVFEQRIMPIFRSPEPSSCVQCHLAAVDLKDYILPSHEKTFVSLRDQGLIDLEHPEKSKILTLIRMGEKDFDKGARLIHERTRQAEYEAFAAWIAACCGDARLRGLPSLEAGERAGPERPLAVVRHARKSRVVDSFVRNVWSQRMRCFPCHTRYEIDETNPQHQKALKRYKQLERQFAEDYSERMNIFRRTPEETIEYLIERSRETPEGEPRLIDLDEPRKSLLVLKPTSKVPRKNAQGELEPPSSVEPVTHMGGMKMHVDDASYKAFVGWVQDYARVVDNQYTSAEDLPADNWFASKVVLLVRPAPEAWPDEARVQLFVHAWDGQAEAWDAEPVAFTQGVITPRRIVGGPLFLLGTSGAEVQDLDRENARLVPGRYLVKAYVDIKHRLSGDPSVMLGEEDFAGQVEIEARWREGFPEAESITGAQLAE